MQNQLTSTQQSDTKVISRRWTCHFRKNWAWSKVKKSYRRPKVKRWSKNETRTKGVTKDQTWKQGTKGDNKLKTKNKVEEKTKLKRGDVQCRDVSTGPLRALMSLHCLQPRWHHHLHWCCNSLKCKMNIIFFYFACTNCRGGGGVTPVPTSKPKEKELFSWKK